MLLSSERCRVEARTFLSELTMSSKGKGKARASSSQGDPRKEKRHKSAGAAEAHYDEPSVSTADRKKYVSDLVRFVLFASNDGSTIRGSGTENKKGIKNILGPAAGDAVQLIEMANKTLRKVFGMELIQLPEEDKKAKHPKKLWKDSESDGEEEEGETQRRKKTTVSNDAQFVLTNILPAEQRLRLTHCDNVDEPSATDTLLLYSNPAYYGLLLSLLSLIYVKDMEISQKELQNFLDKMQLGKDEVYRNKFVTEDPESLSNTFGDGDAMIKLFLTHRYLLRRGDPPGYAYRWGSRAYTEITEAAIVKFIAQIYGEDVQEWASQIDHNIDGLEPE
eukprot:m.1044159 g.1044159  ORF g.1044159 m.1044159 type:complete len:334 (+) comp24169_c0_seq2:123-1124(+)